MKKNISKSLILFLGVLVGLIAGYFVVFGVQKVSNYTNQFVSSINFFKSKEVSQGGPGSNIFEDREGQDVYFLEYNKEYRISDSAPVPYLTADSYLVGDIDSGEIILSRNLNKSLPIASISKLMTAVVADEKIGLSSEIKISRDAINTYGKQGRLSEGDVYSVSEILFPLLLESSNDAAEAIAESYGRDSFLYLMNEKSREIEMYNTNFSDPSGLSPLNMSSSLDLFKLVQYVEKYREYIFDITRNKKYSSDSMIWYNNSKFRSDDSYYGGKNGYTDIAWKTQVAIFEMNFDDETKKIAFIILKTDDVEGDIYGLKRYIERYVTYE